MTDIYLNNNITTETEATLDNRPDATSESGFTTMLNKIDSRLLKSLLSNCPTDFGPAWAKMGPGGPTVGWKKSI